MKTFHFPAATGCAGALLAVAAEVPSPAHAAAAAAACGLGVVLIGAIVSVRTSADAAAAAAGLGWTALPALGAALSAQGHRTLLIDAEKEHYFKIAENSGRVHRILKENGVPTEYHVLEGKKHYDVYSGPLLDKVMKLEIAWFDRYLKVSAEENLAR